MDDFILIKIIKADINELSKFLIKRNIFYSNLMKSEEDIIVKIKFSDFRILKRNYGKRKIKILSYYGYKKVKEFLKTEYLILLSTILGIIIIYLMSNMIFDIEIVTSNKIIRNKITEELKEYGIEKYKFIKSYRKIEKIKIDILEKNKDSLEWLEISRNGTKYIVNLTERIKNEEIKQEELKNIVSSKDALILKIINRRGTSLKVVNEYVYKGETIVSGNIMRGETLVNTVNADADVYGEVWYTVNVTVPFKYVEYAPTGKIVNRYYLKFPFFDMTLFGFYKGNNAIKEKEVILDKSFLLFKLIRERNVLYSYKTYKVNEEMALKEAIKRAEKSIKVTLNNDEHIIDKKVLKNSSFSSKINVEVFFRVYENIREYSPLTNTFESQ